MKDLSNENIIQFEKNGVSYLQFRKLNEYNQYIIGRMGIPYKDKQVSVISVIVDGPNDIIGALSGKLGMVEGVSVKALYSKKENE